MAGKFYKIPNFVNFVKITTFMKIWRYVNQDAVPWILRYHKPMFGEKKKFSEIFPKFIILLISQKSHILQKFWLYNILDKIPWNLRYYKPMFKKKFFSSKNYRKFTISRNSRKSRNSQKFLLYIIWVAIVYIHADFEVSILIPYKDMEETSVRINVALSQPSWIGQPSKNNSAFHFEVLSTITHF